MGTKDRWQGESTIIKKMAIEMEEKNLQKMCGKTIRKRDRERTS